MGFQQIPKSNLHTHTCFCDGKNTPEEMVQAAIDAKMETLGFSGHSYTSLDRSYCMSENDCKLYYDEIKRLKAKYEDQLHIMLGIEQDFYADFLSQGYEYVIGSVHYLNLDGDVVPIDESREVLIQAAKKHFNGDIYALIEAYYQLVSQIPQKTHCDIIGHFDLISKFNEDHTLFDPTDPRYLRAALKALDILLEYDVVFEINTGAMSRGYRRTPYPAPVFLHRIAEKRGTVTVTADAHSREHLLYAYPEAYQFARAAGIGAIAVMTRNGWKNCPL